MTIGLFKFGGSVLQKKSTHFLFLTLSILLLSTTLYTQQAFAATPEAPTGLSADIAYNRIQLSWTAPSGTITGYDYSQNDGDSWTAIADSDASTTSHIVTGLTPGTSYTFKVRAENAEGNGSASDGIIVIPNKIAHGVNSLTLDDGNFFGVSTVLSQDKNMLIVGANKDNDNKGGVHVFVKDNDFWTHTQTIIDGTAAGFSLDNNDHFGHSLALSPDENTLFVGAPNDDTGDTTEADSDDRDDTGAVYLFTKNNNTWSYSTKIAHNTHGLSLTENSSFGSAVTLSPDGNTLFIGALGDDTNGTNEGSIRIFTKRENGTWGFDTWISYGIGGLFSADGDKVGSSLAVSPDGMTLAVGALGTDTGAENAGAVHIFTKQKHSWRQTYVWQHTAVLDGSLSNPTLSADDHFGTSVAFSPDNSLLAVGAIGDDTSGSNTGAVHIFFRNGSAWEYDSSVSTDFADITLNDHDQFGSSVALFADSENNILLLAGAHHDDTGGTDSNRGALHLINFGIDLDTTAPRLSNPESIGLVLDATVDFTFTSDEAGTITYSGSCTSSEDTEAVRGENTVIFELLPAGIYNNCGVTVTDPAGNTSDLLRIPLFAVGFSLPKAPTDLSADVNHDTVTLSWTGPTGEIFPVTHYEYSKDDGANWTSLGNTNTSYAVTNLTLGEAYIFRVRSVNQSGEGPASVGVPVTLFGLEVAAGYDRVGLSWTQPSDTTDVSGYQYRQNDGVWTDIPSSSATTTSYVVESLSQGLTYAFSIRTVDSSDTALATSNQISVIPNKITHGTNGLTFGVFAYFGDATAVSPNGNTLAIGATGDDFSRGAVHLYSRENNIWEHDETIVSGIAGLTYADAYQFGSSVALSPDENTLVVGAEGADTFKGAVHIFTKSDDTWTESVKIANGSSVGNDETLTLSEQDRFGAAVALSSDGNTLVVGASSDDTFKGAVYIFTKNDTAWVQSTRIANDSDGFSLDRSDYFGTSVALSADGNTLVVGAPGDDGGDDTDESADDIDNAGAVHVFIKDTDGNWTHDSSVDADFFHITLSEDDFNSDFQWHSPRMERISLLARSDMEIIAVRSTYSETKVPAHTAQE